MRLVLERARYLALFAVAGITATCLATFALAFSKTASLIDTIVTDRRGESEVIAALSAIDIYLLALAQVIVIIGVYELFVGDLDVPDWLEVNSLDGLKTALVDVLIVFLAVKGIEKLASSSKPVDALVNVGATSLLILSLSVFKALKSAKKT